MNHVGSGGEEGAVASVGRGDAERDGEVRFADAGRPEQEDVAALLDEAEGRELGDERPVELGLEVEVEPGQRLVDRVTGEAEPGALAAGTGGGDLDLQQALEHLGG